MTPANLYRFAFVASAALALATSGALRAAELEQAVKATYLVKFAPFVTWPETAAQGPLKVCVQGRDPFGELLDRAVAGQTFRGKPVTVSRLARIDAAANCDIAYIGGSSVQSEDEALSTLRGLPVLTVADGDQPRPAPAAVLLKLVDGRVRFAVDLVLARRAGLDINSKLLALAVSVKK